MITKLENIIINRKATVHKALQQLDKTAEKILFVVNERNQLIGSLTDGDIRRWVLKSGALQSSVEIEKVCFKGTYFVELGYDIDEVKKQILSKKIYYVPVVNKKKEIIEFLIWDNLFDSKIVRKTEKKLDVDVVIMAGGKGSRLEPFTKILPKPLIPIGEKTVLEIIMEKFIEFNVEHFYLSVNHKAKIIKSYFDEINPNYKISYIMEHKPLGTIGALHQLNDKLKNNFILTNCDIIIEADYLDLLEHHKINNNDLTIVTSMKHYNIPYGVCKIANGGKLIDIVEKPVYDLLVNTGMYVINSSLLKYIPQNEFFHATHFIDRIKNSYKVGVYPISENSWIDIGEWAEYKKAVERFRI